MNPLIQLLEKDILRNEQLSDTNHLNSKTAPWILFILSSPVFI
jgi:hypothetical protein